MVKKSKAIKITIFVLLVLLVAGGIIAQKLWSRTRFNDTYVYGNTAGNYYNKGLFCEQGNLVYFSNPNDKYRLYSMTPQGKEGKQLSKDCASFINADDNYVYYARNNGSYDTDFSFLKINTNSLCRIQKNGKNNTILDGDATIYATLVGNYIYYIHYDKKTASTLYKIKIDGKEKKKVSNFPLLLSASENGNLCYSGVDGEHFINLWNSGTDTSSVLYEAVCYNPIDTPDYVYYMDGEADYKIARFDKSSGEVIFLTDCRVDCYNLTNNYLYYQKNDGDALALCRISLDGSGAEEVVYEGVFCDLNVTSEYVYFRDFKNKDAFFQTPADGIVDVMGFSFEDAE